MTGTFDNWQKTVKLEKHANDFHKTVDLPAEKILYKVSSSVVLVCDIAPTSGAIGRVCMSRKRALHLPRARHHGRCCDGESECDIGDRVAWPWPRVRRRQTDVREMLRAVAKIKDLPSHIQTCLTH